MCSPGPSRTSHKIWRHQHLKPIRVCSCHFEVKLSLFFFSFSPTDIFLTKRTCLITPTEGGTWHGGCSSTEFVPCTLQMQPGQSPNRGPWCFVLCLPTHLRLLLESGFGVPHFSQGILHDFRRVIFHWCHQGCTPKVLIWDQFRYGIFQWRMLKLNSYALPWVYLHLLEQFHL